MKALRWLRELRLWAVLAAIGVAIVAAVKLLLGFRIEERAQDAADGLRGRDDATRRVAAKKVAALAAKANRRRGLCLLVGMLAAAPLWAADREDTRASLREASRRSAAKADEVAGDPDAYCPPGHVCLTAAEWDAVEIRLRDLERQVRAQRFRFSADVGVGYLDGWHPSGIVSAHWRRLHGYLGAVGTEPLAGVNWTVAAW